MAEINLQPIRDKMMEELKVLEKTCENCEYELEDMEGMHCRHCIHNAIENFKPKEIHYTEQEIRNKAIDEFVEHIEWEATNHWVFDLEDEEEHENFLDEIRTIAEQLKVQQ